MKNIINKMFGKAGKVLVGYNVLLSANMAKPAMHGNATIQTIFCFTFGLV
jgi:hypothetical protein